MTEPNLTTIRSRRAEIAKLRRALDTEDGELEIAERVLTRLGATPPPPPPNGADTRSLTVLTTHADLVKGTLRHSANMWFNTARELQQEIKKNHGVEIQLNSLQPLLWNFKKHGIIVRDKNNRIALAERLKAQEGANEKGQGGELSLAQ